MDDPDTDAGVSMDGLLSPPFPPIPFLIISIYDPWIGFSGWFKGRLVTPCDEAPFNERLIE